MRYLFFDIECADGSKAICEFGYVVCDENFNVLGSDNILINPEEKFRLTGRKGQKDLVLSYEHEEYEKHESFPKQYDFIKQLLTQEDIMVFGHGVSNDIQFIIKDCNRYKLDKYYYVAYDIQCMLPLFSSEGNKHTSLEKAFADLVPNGEELGLIDHRALDDAKKTMLVLKAMLNSLGISVAELIGRCPDCKLTALEVWKKHKINKAARHSKRGSKTSNQGQVLWGEFYRECEKQLQEESSYGRIVTVWSSMKRRPDELTILINCFKKNGFVGSDRISNSNYLIVHDESEKKELFNVLKYPYEGKILTYIDFISLAYE